MTPATRTMLIPIILLATAGAAFGQQPAPGTQQTQPAAETASLTGIQSAEDVRLAFSRVLEQHPREVGRILTLDPTLLSNEPFLSRYPELADFLAAHPEIRRNPHYYLRNLHYPDPRSRAPYEDVLETVSIVSIFALITFALVWFIRTIIEQKRWSWLSRTQAEVHNKILDRFGSSEELLAYIKSPAGTKFLESAPIPLHVENVPHTPLTRVMWSIQIGLIVAAAGLGMLLVSTRFEPGAAAGFFAMGAIAFCIGAGFIASAVVSIFLSRRLGLWQGSEKPSALEVRDM